MTNFPIPRGRGQDRVSHQTQPSGGYVPQPGTAYFPIPSGPRESEVGSHMQGRQPTSFSRGLTPSPKGGYISRRHFPHPQGAREPGEGGRGENGVFPHPTLTLPSPMGGYIPRRRSSDNY